MTETNVGAIDALKSPEEAKQVSLGRSLPPGDVQGRKPIDWSFGPVKVDGYVDPDSFRIGLLIVITGINIGKIYGNLKDGVSLMVDLYTTEGEMRFFLKNDNEVWVHLKVGVVFDGKYDVSYKIVSI
ncbi:hypothetical protein Cob_v011372 [Colletotrichum orbiculare MAFF 240422]|uniref:Uncharacterized protein n=1 Tax=Colletotrichum orbiculare (strain 104-T / ATCC 96160 / CBS 514.97 / LARS 414 / MAFF 240422) TaxID=1213857 RepID=N4V2U7_COLOR|nr:hypothetical protein Cob_v011372 [Colletotrichum orbiculare MAFF 240422]